MIQMTMVAMTQMRMPDDDDSIDADIDDDDESGDSNKGIWGAESANKITDVVRMQSLGNAKSVALKINGPTESSSWEINGIMFTYKPRRLR